MTERTEHSGPILRVFEARPTPGRVDTLLERFATTSAAVVAGEPGNLGYVFGRVVDEAGDSVVFVSVWADMAAVRARFGDEWRSSHLPPGYDDLIESCSVRHVEVAGWHLRDSAAGTDRLLEWARPSGSTSSE